MKIAIVDDEPIWIRKAEERIRAFYEFPVDIEAFSSGEELLERDDRITANREEAFDVVFLDVEMDNGMDGFETTIQFKSRHEQTPVILLTAHGEFSRRGYRVKAFRYLEKQYLEEIDEALESIGLINPKDVWVTLPLPEGGSRLARTIDIQYAEAIAHGTRICLEKEEFRSLLSLQKLEQLLVGELEQEEQFCRCHQAFVVNWRYVADIRELDAVMESGEKIPISRRRLREATLRFGQYNFKRANR